MADTVYKLTHTGKQIDSAIDNAVRSDAQTLTTAQQTQARANVGGASASDLTALSRQLTNISNANYWPYKTTGTDLLGVDIGNNRGSANAPYLFGVSNASTGLINSPYRNLRTISGRYLSHMWGGELDLYKDDTLTGRLYSVGTDTGMYGIFQLWNEGDVHLTMYGNGNISMDGYLSVRDQSHTQHAYIDGTTGNIGTDGDVTINGSLNANSALTVSSNAYLTAAHTAFGAYGSDLYQAAWMPITVGGSTVTVLVRQGG